MIVSFFPADEPLMERQACVGKHSREGMAVNEYVDLYVP
jgi:hypothetical protein